MINFLNELIDDSGYFIQGDEPFNQSDSMSKSKFTTDDFIRSAGQGNSRFWKYTMFEGDGEVIDESKIKMKEMVDDILSKRNGDREFIKKSDLMDLYSNKQILDLETISEDDPIVVRKTRHLIDLINKNETNENERAIILNTLLSEIQTDDIPSHFKKQLINLLK